MTKVYFAWFFILFLLLSGCSMIQGTDEIVKQTFHDLEPFTDIQVRGVFEVVYRQSDDVLAVIKMQEALFESLEIEV